MIMKKYLCFLISVCTYIISVQGQTVLNTINGSVSDSEGQPIPGVSVITTDGKYGTITDNEGNFMLDVPEKTTLLFSCLGYNEQKMKVTHLRHEYHVSLNEDTATLQGVVVVGYGSARKDDLTGSITHLPCVSSSASGSSSMKQESHLP